MASVIPSSALAIMPLVVTRLANYLIALKEIKDAGPVQLTVRHPDLVEHWTADQQYLVWPLDERNQSEYEDGGGRFDTRTVRHFAVAVRSRMNLDASGYGPSMLTDDSRGHLLRERHVKDALHLAVLTDDGTSAGNAVLDHPMRWTMTETQREDAQDPGWVTSLMHFELSYQDDLDVALEDFGGLGEAEG